MPLEPGKIRNVAVVGHRGALLHGSEAIRGAALKEKGLDERRLACAAMAHDGHVADLAGLRSGHGGRV